MTYSFLNWLLLLAPALLNFITAYLYKKRAIQKQQSIVANDHIGRIIGIQIFIILFLVVHFTQLFSLQQFLFCFQINFGAVVYILFFAAAVRLMQYLTFKKGVPPAFQIFSTHQYPTIFIVQYVYVWINYLFVYEFYFRAVLLFALQDWVGTIWSVIINVMLYAIVHLHKNKKEIVGSIPLGVVLCLITLHTQSVWPAFIIHCLLPLHFELPFLIKNSSFTLKKI